MQCSKGVEWKSLHNPLACFCHPLRSWEPECTQVALAYEHSIELCRTRPAFERFASLSVADSVAGGYCCCLGMAAPSL